MSKRVVLVTWDISSNYGTCLQSLALYRKMEQLGYSVSFLPFLPSRYNFSYQFKTLVYKTKIKRFFSHDLKWKKFDSFRRKYYHIARPITKQQEEKIISKTDVFIVGSDQVWNTNFRFSPFCFLDFAKDKKRISYAPSIGTTNVKAECRERVRRLLMKFSHISVRESNAVTVLKDITGRDDIVQVLDPTFLLEPGEWDSLCRDARYEIDLPKEYILTYLIGDNASYRLLLNKVTEHRKEKVVIIPSSENPDFDYPGAIVYKTAGPLEFVDLIRHAAFVCTDSFHATALSINFSIPFVEFLRFPKDSIQSQNSRIYDILSHFGLQQQLFESESFNGQFTIDYTHAQDVLSKDRRISFNYLVSAIEH
ncbi:MAG: polysaccharide pyruvyl transferase family protein [Desulfovibrionaceae bacterium]|nr:polysaccharide pyruvyl transferase family protein [Desulfovibrionaceae bacterium]